MYVLLASNGLTIFLALRENWSFPTLVWTYWMQSVIIGIFQAARIFLLNKFSTQGMSAGGKPIPETREGKISTGIFFIFHYGFFHVVYLFFLSYLWGEVEVRNFLIGSAIFLFNHLFSFIQDRKDDQRSVPSLGRMMFRPYLRIFPIHLVICLALPFLYHSLGVTIFLFLKTIFDTLAHMFEHAEMRAGIQTTQNPSQI